MEYTHRTGNELMAIKRVVRECCQYCGERMATLKPDGSVRVEGHNCDEGPPGPPNPPYTYRPNEVIFEPQAKPEG